MKFATVTKDGKIVLPKEMAQKLKYNERFLVIENGKALTLNPITIPDVTQIAKRKKNSKPMDVKEISNEVHLHRKEKRAQ